jgi:hypothetical protein
MRHNIDNIDAPVFRSIFSFNTGCVVSSSLELCISHPLPIPRGPFQATPLFMCSPLFNVLSTSRMERLNFRIEATARAPESASRLSFTRIAYIHVEYVL